ncbi:hypothetical protein GCM10020358_64080 [Amorphoplanes nipponensis]|uniref:CBM2 domain-containing protein n=1 Tax=Actinoplanes nipponensis TaxID=135950 RepID=A0A919JMR1_9ACTN|nr:cellulose binding domain-containing protein [Actinoplanes nipponensis]GIE52187.1 hypothetical protein Ani05nite_57210 [Actinoplanes nipponensis]
MPGKHTTVFPLRRYSFIAAAATLLVVLVSWVAVRAVGPAQPDNRVPLLVQPTVPLGGATPAALVSASPAAASTPPPASPSPSRSASASASARPTAKPTEKTTTKPAPRRTTAAPRPPAASFTAAYRTGASWERGFIGAVQVTNTSGQPRAWTVRIAYPAAAGVRVGNVWNAQLTRQDDAFVLTGGPLAPGATANLGFEASKQVRDAIQPTACTVDGAPCRVS